MTIAKSKPRVFVPSYALAFASRRRRPVLFALALALFACELVREAPRPPATVVIDTLPASGPAAKGTPEDEQTARKSRLLQQPESRDFALTEQDLGRALQEGFAGYRRNGGRSERLETLRTFEFPLEAAHCVRVVLRLGDDSLFSDVARRGLDAEFSVGSESSQVRVVGPGILTEPLCPKRGGLARLVLRTRLQGLIGGLGQGEAKIEVWLKKVVTPTDREAAIARETKGYLPGAIVTVRLDQPIVRELRVARGECLVAVLRLQKGARLADEALDHVSTELDLPNETRSAGPGVIGPGIVASFACTQASSKATLAFKVPSSGPLGTGPATLQLYTRSAPDRELRANAAEDRAAMREQNRSIANRKVESCRECVEERISCQRRGAGSCLEGFLTCVRSKGYRESECGG